MKPPISERHQDFLKELINVGIGQGAQALNEMTEYHVKMKVPELRVFDHTNIQEYYALYQQRRLAAVEMEFQSELNGAVKLIFPEESALKLVEFFTGEPAGPDSRAMSVSALSEIGNIVINSVVSEISGQLDLYVQYTVPRYVEESIDRIMDPLTRRPGFAVLMCHARFEVEELCVAGDLVLVFEIGHFETFSQKVEHFYQRMLEG